VIDPKSLLCVNGCCSCDFGITRIRRIRAGTLPYHPEEITELYLGAAMTGADMEDILGKAQAV